MQAARYKKGNKFHLVELFNIMGEPSGSIEVYDNKEKAVKRVEELNKFCDNIKEVNYGKC